MNRAPSGLQQHSLLQDLNETESEVSSNSSGQDDDEKE
jgi:hypothetical protein